MQALQGIKVLDLTQLLPGPYAGMILADFGAEVIKIEQPGKGDPYRSYQPHKAGVGYRHIILNRNKKSLTLNLKTAEGKEIFHKLAKEADVIIEGFRPGVMARLGADYETVKAINPRIIYCSLTGFGQTGPYRLEPGHDLNYISLAGITSLTGEKNGKPQIPGIQIADMTGGLMAAMGISLALNSRYISGQGQYIDISLFNAALGMLPSDASMYFGSGKVTQRGESRLIGSCPNYNIYRTKDGRHLAIGANEHKFWENLCKVIGREDLMAVFAELEGNTEVFAILEETFAAKTLAEWKVLLDGKETCVTPVNTLDETFDDPQVKASEMVLELTDEKLGKYRQLGIPIKLCGTPGSLKTKAPELGEHTAELLKKMGYSEEKVQEYKTNGII
jgi:crotonobetainyl-CoA:carnitine CoA-transferase CaiB-like acyl-CoA transferase